MDPFYNNNSGYNASHRSTSSNQPPNQSSNPTPHASVQQAAGVPPIQPPEPTNVRGVSIPGAPSVIANNYSIGYNNTNVQVNASNAQYRAAVPTAARPMQPTTALQQQQPTTTSYAQQQAQPGQQHQTMYSPQPPTRPSTAIAPPIANIANNNVPNPLGLGGVPAPTGVAVQQPGNGAAPTGPSNKKDLLRSMYQSARQRQPAASSSQQAQQTSNAQQQTQVNGQVQQQQYRSSTGIQHQVQGVHQHQPQPQGIQAQQSRVAAPNATPNAAFVQNNNMQQGYRSSTIQTATTNTQQQPNFVAQQVGVVSANQMLQPSPMQRSSQPVSMQQQQQQQQQQVSTGQYQQSSPQRMVMNNQQQQQQQQQQYIQQSQQRSPQQQQSHSSSSSSHHQLGGGEQQQQKKPRFHLSQQAKVALREAVLSAIRHPQGTVDQACLQRAMAQGLPEKAILNAASVARQRDQKNRQQRLSNSSSRQQQQQGQQQQQSSGSSSSQQSMSSHQQQLRQPQMPQQQQQVQQQQSHSSRGGIPTSFNSLPSNANTTTAQQQQAQMRQQLYTSSQQPGTNQVVMSQYNQQQQQNASLYQQQQQQQQQRAQLQAQQQQAKLRQQQQYQRQQLEAKQKAQEDARKKQLQQYQEQQRRLLLEEQRKKKELEEQRAVAKAAADERARRSNALVNRMKGWKRTEFGLVVNSTAKGLPQQQQNVGLLKQSTWGGASMCLDNEPALTGALKRASTAKSKSQEACSSTKQRHPPNVQNAINIIRKQLLMQPSQQQPMLKENTSPPTKEELRRKRLSAIASKVLDPKQSHTMCKRLKLQPKRESKFLDKHIRRARQITATELSRRHKDLLKAIVTHQSEFYKFHRLKKNECAKIARAIRDQHRKAEVAKEKDSENAEKARLAALRSNDMAAYTSLLNDTKNERLKFLLDKTDECMNQISTLLASRAAEEEEDIKLMGGEGTIKATFSKNQEVTGGSYYETAHVKSESVRQPSLLTGGDLKEYQLGGLQWMVSLYNNRLNGILADEMGLGKTIQTIALIAYLIEVKQNLGPYLVIVPLSTLSNWVNEFSKWLPAATVICYKGSPQQRKALFRDEVADGHFNVLLTTYEFVIRDKASLRKLAWQYAIVDEGHRMKNNQSKFSVTLGTQYNTRRRVLLTGTPLQNNLPELWALLNFLLPEVFNSAESFDQWFNKPFSNFGKTGSGDTNGEDSSNELISNEERMLIIHRLHELLRPFMLRRVKSEVLDQLPEKVEKVIRCDLSSWQKELYKQISRKIVGETASQGKNFNRGLNNVVMQLRKVCNHPYLFTKEGYHINDDIIRTSGKIELLDRMLPKLKAAGHRVLMFTQMTKMMPILEDYFAYRGFTSLRLDGSTSADEREKRMYMFNAPDSPYFIFLLSTRAGGLGLNLATADTVIIFDSDWNPMMDLQAQDRAHRIGQKKDVRVFRIITQTPVEEKILSRATEKLQMNELVVEAGKFDKSGQKKDDNSLERLKMMELLLTDFDENQNAQSTATAEEDFEKDTDDGEGEEEGEDNKNLFNEMISSNDDDYKLYCKLDMEGTNAPELYSDLSSAPDWIIYPSGAKPEEGADELVDNNGFPEFLGKRRAAAGDKSYDDGLTEKQFCRMMDKQHDAEKKSKKKAKGKKRKADLDSSAILDDGGGRKRAKAENFIDDSSLLNSSRAASSNASGAGSDEVTPAVQERLFSVTKSVIYYKDKATQRKLSEIFLEKPCPQTYPDYYQIIEKPIGMNDILRKCRAMLYTSLKDFRDDWNNLFKNALTYNGVGSWIVLDAETLKGELDKLMDKNRLSANAVAKKKKPVRLKLSLKKSGKKKKAAQGGDGGDEMKRIDQSGSEW